MNTIKWGIFFISLFLTSCTDEGRTRSTLHSIGFTDVQTQGYDMWACSEDDSYSTQFTATNPQGQRVSGAVCCGLLKNCTVRF